MNINVIYVVKVVSMGMLGTVGSMECYLYIAQVEP